jgi:O-antigen/teichoic acid export membrane protein
MRVNGRQIVDWMLAVFAANVVLLFLNVYTGVGSARALGPVGKGLYNAVMLWQGVGSSLSAGGLAPAFIVLYAREGAQRGRTTLTSALLLSIAWSGVVAAGMMMIVSHALGHLGDGVTRWTRLALLTLPLSGVVGVLQTLMTAEHAFRWYNALRVVQALALAVPLTILWLTGSLTPLKLVALSVANGIVAGLVVVVAALVLMRHRGIRLGRFEWPITQSLSLMGARFYAVGLASLFNARLDQMLTTAWLSARDMGLYAVAGSSLSVVAMASGAFQTVFLPAVAGDDRSSIVWRTETGFRRATWVLFVLAMLTILLAQPVLALAYGPAYLDAWPPILALTPAAVSAALLGVLYQGCYALGDAGVPFAGEVVGAVSGALLLWAMVPRYGLVGAATATSVSYLLDLGVVLCLWARRSGGHGLVPGRADFGSVVVAIHSRARQWGRQREAHSGSHA